MLEMMGHAAEGGRKNGRRNYIRISRVFGIQSPDLAHSGAQQKVK